MKAFLKLVVVIFSLAYVTPMMAEMQSSHERYIDVSKVLVSNEGIFFQNHHNEWLAVKGIPQNLNEAQIGGILDILFPDKNYIAKCNNCGVEYINRAPQPCEHCDLKVGMELIYEQDGYWD